MPHGLVGQSFAWDGAKNGKTDEYPESGYYKTSAMAEGAIEGEAAMYQVASAYETHFAFSRFDAAYEALLRPDLIFGRPQGDATSDAAASEET